MKKAIYLIMSILLVFTLGACNNKAKNQEDVSHQGDLIEYNYQELKAESKIVVKVEVMDDLSEKNSVIEYDPDDPETIIESYSLRKVKVIESFKSDRKVSQGDVLKVIESAAIHDGQYLHLEEYEKMEKGNTYILFLSDETESGELSIISASNGLIDLKHPQDSQYFEIAVKGLVEYESDLSKKEKQRLLKADVKQANDEQTKALDKETKIKVKDGNGKIINHITMHYSEDKKGDILVNLEDKAT